MKLLVFGDIHQDIEAVKAIMGQKADFYICHGDLSDRGQGLELAAKTLAPLKNKLWLLPGNNETWEQTKELCQKYGFTDFHQKVVKQGNFFLAGLGYTIPTPFNTPGEREEKEFCQVIKKFTAQKNLCLFTHDSLKDTELDLISSGIHVGNQAIRDFIVKSRPIYAFSGHVHENEGKIQRVGQTTCFNVGKQGLAIWL